jgi:hypothetical protein
MGGIVGTFKNKPADELTLDQLEHAITEELEQWKEEGLDPNGVTHNVWTMDVQVNTIIQLLFAKGICTQDEFQLTFRRTMLEKLRASRADLAPVYGKRAQLRAALTEGIRGPLPRPGG